MPVESILRNNYVKYTSVHLRLLLWLGVIILIIFDWRSTFIIIIGAIIALLCANKCVQWAIEKKKDKNIAYFIGFVFGLLGLIVYSIYLAIVEK